MKELPAGVFVLIIILGVIVLAAVLYCVWAFIEPNLFEVTERKLSPADKDTDFRKQSPGVIPSGKVPGLRLFFFTDLHAELCRVSSKRLISALRAAHNASPLDAVIFGGDICNDYNTSGRGLSYLKEVSDVCTELNIPFYGVTGNHDLEFDPSDGKCHFTSIEGRQIEFRSHSTGRPVILCGVDDSGRKERVWYKVPPVPSDCISVLVCHNPDAILHFGSDEHVDYMLSGHFHAGQLKMPFRLEFARLRSDILPRKKVVEGVFEYKGTTFFISRGLGCNAIPVRFGAIPEASVVEIYD